MKNKEMKSYYTLFIFLLMISFGEMYSQSDEYVVVPFNISVVPDVSIGALMAKDKKVNNMLSFNIYGKAARLTGMEIGC